MITLRFECLLNDHLIFGQLPVHQISILVSVDILKPIADLDGLHGQHFQYQVIIILLVLLIVFGSLLFWYYPQ
jgi:hypothetical protein